MRFVRIEQSPANKKQYTMAMGKKDIELLKEMALLSHRYFPRTKALQDDRRRLASIAKAFAEAQKLVEYDTDEGDRLPLEERQKYKNKLNENHMAEITRLEIIDHRPCPKCHGDRFVLTETDTAGGQSTAFRKECPECQGMGSKGRQHIFTDPNVEVKSSVQDEGRTLKLFIGERES